MGVPVVPGSADRGNGCGSCGRCLGSGSGGWYPGWCGVGVVAVSGRQGSVVQKRRGAHLYAVPPAHAQARSAQGSGSPLVAALAVAARIAQAAEQAGIPIKLVGVMGRGGGSVSALVDTPSQVVDLAAAIGVDVYRIREYPAGRGETRLGTCVCQLDYVPPSEPDGSTSESGGSVRVSIAAYITSKRKGRDTGPGS